jgi:hypothetical protein
MNEWLLLGHNPADLIRFLFQTKAACTATNQEEVTTRQKA